MTNGLINRPEREKNNDQQYVQAVRPSRFHLSHSGPYAGLQEKPSSGQRLIRSKMEKEEIITIKCWHCHRRNEKSAILPKTYCTCGALIAETRWETKASSNPIRLVLDSEHRE
jgi:hypothetical protein